MPTQMKTQRSDGPAIKARRQSLGLSREALGAAAGGVSSSTVRRIERCEVQPHPSTVAALKGALDTAEAAHNDHEPAASELVEKAGDDGAHQAE